MSTKLLPVQIKQQHSFPSSSTNFSRGPCEELSEKAKTFLRSIDPLDEYGFQIRPHFYWLPESVEDEIKRLETNLAIYEHHIKNRSRFPRDIDEARMRDYKRLAYLKGGLHEVV